MAARKFRFVSPGVFLKEIDNSKIPGIAPGIGPVIIGRTRQGPSMKPYTVESQEEFLRVFGDPMPGNEGEDPWRDGTQLLAESYLPYAANAYLSADINSPVTVIRLAGVPGADADAAGGTPGWQAKNAYGLFLYGHSGSYGTDDTPPNDQLAHNSASLAAIFYGANDEFEVYLKGQDASAARNASSLASASAGQAVLASQVSGRINLVLRGANSVERSVKFLLDDIRKEFNTNPVSTNTRISDPSAKSLAKEYWLGETFDEEIRKVQSVVSAGDKCSLAAFVLRLDDDMADFKSINHQLKPACTGWFIHQDVDRDYENFDPKIHERLFRIHALQEGFDGSRNLIVAIEDIKLPRSASPDSYGSFSVVVKRIYSTEIQVVERFDNCNLNPASENYVARLIGTQYFEWDTKDKRNKLYETHPNRSEYIRVEMNPDVDRAGPDNNSWVPFGFFGPIVPKDTTFKKATATIVAPAPGALENAATFGIVDSDNTTTTYRINGGGAFGTQAGGDKGATIDMFVGGAGSAADVRTAIIGAINATNNRQFEVIGGTGTNIVIQQLSYGTAGNKDNTSGGGVTVGNFEGGTNADGWLVSPQQFMVSSSADGMQLRWPDFPLVATGSDADDYMLGATPYKVNYLAGTGSSITREINPGYVDHVRRMSSVGSSNLVESAEGGKAVGSLGKYSFVFSLDDVILHPVDDGTDPGALTGSITRASDVAMVVYESGSYRRGDSFTAYWSTSSGASNESIRPLLRIVGGFHAPLVGGTDGVDITEADPFNNSADCVGPDATTRTSYSYASVDRAIELIRDPEVLEHNLALMPGITNEKLTKKLVDTCESRADSLAIIDLPNVYVPPFEESCNSFRDRIKKTPDQSADDLVNRRINSSYGAAYYPWVKIRDNQFGRDVWVPPSVVALGVMAYTEETSEVWFAPAGFNRGGLNQGNAGCQVLQASEQLMARDRDTLYEANINPIATFVSEGLVVFGQKTLQVTQSALDRINVRRLLIFIKKEISRISNSILFEQNVQVTWNRFLTRAVPFLEGVKQRFGLTDFRVILDGTTTTPDLIDRNIMYAKVLLKPARAIEFIAVDFVITRTGASFDD